MENIFLPSKIEYKKGKNPHESQLVIEPLFHGYGITIGNALRRALLSSLPGAAVSAVKIKGVDHEFQAIKGVKDDALEVVLNLKMLRFKMHTDNPVKLSLKKKGIGIVTAADFEKNAEVEVMNPEAVIAEITDKGAEFDMEVTIQKGIGFDPKENRDRKDKEVGLIEIDSIYTPIRNVGYEVEDTRVGQITNYDKLTLTVETDGSIEPEDAIREATKILTNHFNLLAPSVES